MLNTCLVDLMSFFQHTHTHIFAVDSWAGDTGAGIPYVVLSNSCVGRKKDRLHDNAMVKRATKHGEYHVW